MTRPAAAPSPQERDPRGFVRDATAPLVAPPDDFFTVHRQDARRLDVFLARYSPARRPLVTATITSPPYWRLKDYGDKRQIGYGQRLDEYLIDMRRVFRATHAHTKRNGSMWVVADTLRQPLPESEIWGVELLPFQLSQEAQQEGWVLRDVIVGSKTRRLPGPAAGGCGTRSSTCSSSSTALSRALSGRGSIDPDGRLQRG